MLKKYLLGCDWGTSSFRLRLFNTFDKKVEGEICSDDGALIVHQLWQSNSENHSFSCEQFFRKKLNDYINILANKTDIVLADIPVVISGMASSSIGLYNLPYSKLPFFLDGSEVSSMSFDSDIFCPHHILLVSGVRGEDDVMRGEETQLIGLISLLLVKKQMPLNAIFILPGTHSKHIHIQNNVMTDFKTFMTGEIYNLLGTKSILKDSVTLKGLSFNSTESKRAFLKGVSKSSSNMSILNSLFSVRTNQLLGKIGKDQNAFYLSGILIGSELKELLIANDCPIFLCCNNNLHEFYEYAMQELGLNHTTILSSEIIDEATIIGQYIIWKKHN